MNQILVTKKLYITPELRRKKNIYKFHFVLSIFLVCILTSLYIYAEYDRNKSEAASQDILADVNHKIADDDSTLAKDDVLVVVLDGTIEDYEDLETNIPQQSVADINASAEVKQLNGYKYKTIATISIPKINLNYGIVQGITGSLEETEVLLKSSPVKYHGCEPNEIGNFCVVGHNYRNEKFFSKVPNLVVGDKIYLTDLTGRTVTYQVYDKHTVDPEDTRDTTQLTGGRKELTVITCTDDSKQRVVLRTKEVN